MHTARPRLLSIVLLTLVPGVAAAGSTDVVVVVEDTPEARKADPKGDRWRTVDVARQMLSDDDRLGVVTFGQESAVAAPLAEPRSSASFRPPKAPAGAEEEGSDPLSGIGAALDTLEQGKRDGANSNMVVVVVTDPEEPSSSLLQKIIDRARQVGAAVHGLRAGKKGPSFLDQLGRATGGSSERLKRPRQMPLTFQTVFDRLLPGRGTELPNGRLPVDPSIRQARFVVETADPKQVRLVRPNGKRVGAGGKGKGLHWVVGDESIMVTVDKPKKGTWRMDAPHGARVRAWIETDVRLEATLAYAKVKPRSLVPVRGNLVKGSRKVEARALPPGLTMSATIPEVGGDRARTLRDDGSDEDEKADDGVFQGSLRAPSTPGVHDVVVKATAPGFFRRVVVPLEVSVGEVATTLAEPEAEAEPVPERPTVPPPEEAPAGGPTALQLALGGLGAAALVALLLFLWLRKRRDPFEAGLDDLSEEEPPIEQDEVDRVVEDYLAAAGRSLDDPPQGWPDDDRPVLLLDRRGAFTARVTKAIRKGLHFERAEDESDARDRLQEAPTPEVLVLVDPLSRGTIRSLVHWLRDTIGMSWLPIVRVIDAPTHSGVLDELKAGVLDVLSAATDGGSALQRFRRALFAGDKARRKRMPSPKRHASPSPSPPPPPAPEPPPPAPEAGAASLRPPRYKEGDDFDWVGDRLERLPLPLRITGQEGETSGVLVDVGFEGFAVAAKRAAKPGTSWSFESDLFVSLALERVDGVVAHCLKVDAPGYPYLWEVDYDALDDVHGKRIENCYWGLVNSL